MSSPVMRSSIFSSTLVIITLIISISIVEAEEGPEYTQESDRVFGLPGQPKTPAISQYSGYITVNKQRGRALFYWFFEAQTQPSKRPLLLWLNGGPGCSSIGYGAAVELGPLRVKRFGKGVEFNKYAWNKEANLLFLESPVGVGFSYTNTSSDLSNLEDHFVAEDAYSFLVNWMKRFPQFQAHDFYIAGESYAGHYVPQLAELVYESNKDKEKNPHINLKGFIVGNPETDDYYDMKGIVEYAWSHSVISDQSYEHINRVCNFKLVNWTVECNIAVNSMFGEYNKIDIYNIYAPKCNVVDKTSSDAAEMDFSKRMRILAGYDPCFSNYVEEYINRADVQGSLHASAAGRHNVEAVTKLTAIPTTVVETRGPTIRTVKLASGDADGRVPVIGSRYCVESLGLPFKTQWQTWYLDQQVGGRFVEYQGLTMVTIRGAGHLVPLNKPQHALVLINSFLMGKNMPS